MGGYRRARTTDLFKSWRSRDSEVRHFSEDEVSEMETQAVEGGKQQIEMSDPETRDAILRVKQELEKNRAQEAASGTDSDSSE